MADLTLSTGHDGFLQGHPILVLQKADGTETLTDLSGMTDTQKGTALTNAKTAADSGSTIFVPLGSYLCRDLAKDGVTYHLAPGADIYWNAAGGHVFNITTAITVKIRGHGSIRNTYANPTPGNTDGAIYVNHANAVVHVECDYLEAATDVTGTLSVIAGTVFAKVRHMKSLLYDALLIEGGTSNIDAELLEAIGGTNSNAIEISGASSAPVHVVNVGKCTSTTGYCVNITNCAPIVKIGRAQTTNARVVHVTASKAYVEVGSAENTGGASVTDSVVNVGTGASVFVGGVLQTSTTLYAVTLAAQSKADIGSIVSYGKGVQIPDDSGLTQLSAHLTLKRIEVAAGETYSIIPAAGTPNLYLNGYFYASKPFDPNITILGVTSALLEGDETMEVVTFSSSAALATTHNTQWLRASGTVTLTINSDATQNPDYADNFECVVEVTSGTLVVVGENASSQPTINGSATNTVSATSGLVFIKRVAANTWVVKKDQAPVVAWSFTMYETGGITTGLKPVYKACPTTGTIVGYRLTSNAALDATIDLCVEDDGTLPVSGDKVTASAPMDTNGDAITESTTLTGWTTAVNEGDIGAVNVLTSDGAGDFLELQILIQPVV